MKKDGISSPDLYSRICIHALGVCVCVRIHVYELSSFGRRVTSMNDLMFGGTGG